VGYFGTMRAISAHGPFYRLSLELPALSPINTKLLSYFDPNSHVMSKMPTHRDKPQPTAEKGT
jgi:hypothetical protein